MKNYMKIFGLALTVVIIISSLVYVVFAFDTSRQNTSLEVDDALTLLIDDWQKGNKDAKVTVIEYSDLQCPACAVVDEQIVKPILEEYSEKINFSYRHFPLSMHENAVSAAWASESAGRQDKFWEMKDKLFGNQEEWSSTSSPEVVFKKFASELGLDMEKFSSDYSSTLIKELVQEDTNRANSLSLNSTPTFFVNGKKVPPLRSKEDLENAINEALED